MTPERKYAIIEILGEGLTDKEWYYGNIYDSPEDFPQRRAYMLELKVKFLARCEILGIDPKDVSQPFWDIYEIK